MVMPRILNIAIIIMIVVFFCRIVCFDAVHLSVLIVLISSFQVALKATHLATLPRPRRFVAA
jgi:hypothetical protein